MGQRSIYARTLQEAADLLGSRDALARQLLVPRAALERWLAGDEHPPIEAFLRATDIIVLHEDGSAPA